MNTRKFIMATTLLALGGFAASAQNASTTIAGTQITNQASVGYTHPDTGKSSTAYSNTVVTVVNEICGIGITPNGTVSSPSSVANAIGGETVVFPYTVTNTGNSLTTLPIEPRIEGVSTVTATVTAYLDENGNGQIDAGESEVSSVSLEAGASAAVLVSVVTAESAPSGSAFVNLVGSCPSGEGVDDNNVAELRIGTPPTIEVQKTFAPANIRPGQKTTVTISATNAGDRNSRQVVLSDDLSAQRARGLEFVAGTASTNVGRIEYFDGAVWSSAEPAQVRGIRVVADQLQVGQSIRLSFQMQAQESADGENFINVATASSNGRDYSDDATVVVKYNPSVAIGPEGNPEAAEGTPEDSQTQTPANANESGAVCFSHTLKNTGDVADQFTITVTFPQGSANYQLYGADGTPLAQPITLQPGEEIVVQACYTAYGDEVVEAILTVTGERGTTNATTDFIRPLPKLDKQVAFINGKVPENDSETGEPILRVNAGDTVTYTLTAVNTYGLDLTDVSIIDRLPQNTEFVSAVPAPNRIEGTVGSQKAIWDYATFADGTTKTFEITVKVLESAQMGEAITNVFDLVSTEVEVESPKAKVYVPIKIDVDKKADVRQANIGDRVQFTITITNPSAIAALKPVGIIDVLDNPEALEYIAGTSTITYAGEETTPFEDPEIGPREMEIDTGSHLKGETVEEVMYWQLPKLEPKQSVTITYEMRVEAGAADLNTLGNFVLARGKGPGGASDIARDFTQEEVQVVLEAFAATGDLLGLVYVDRDRSGSYDKGIDTPVNRARVVLAGGRISVTDQDGRYSFLNIPMGTHAVRLDPNTVPYLPLIKPQEGGLMGTQQVHVRGLDHADFPLAPLAGDVDVIRRTTLKSGPLTVTKVVFRTSDDYVVNLYMDTAQSLKNVTLNDPLPTGAVLQEGTAGYQGSLNESRTVSYRFEFDGEAREAVTDPLLEWR